MIKVCMVIITVSILFLAAYTTIVPVKSFMYNLTRPPTAAEIQADTQKIIDRMVKGFEEEGCNEGTISEMMKCSTRKKLEKVLSQLGQEECIGGTASEMMECSLEKDWEEIK